MRDEVERLLRSGIRWRVTYCAGTKMPPSEGTGLDDFPSMILASIPTPAQLRKLARGKRNSSYAFATLTQDEAGQLLLVEEE